MKLNAIFYHAGCPVCVDAQRKIIQAINENKYDIEVVHFSDQPDRIPEAVSLGVRSVPALLIENEVFHINFGASLSDLTAS